MAQTCVLCGVTTQFGNQKTYRGMAKRKGGVGIKITGVTRRTFKANIQHKKCILHGVSQTISVCTRCIKAGFVEKPPQRAFFHFAPPPAAKPPKETKEAKVTKDTKGTKGAKATKADKAPQAAKGSPPAKAAAVAPAPKAAKAKKDPKKTS